MKAEALPSLKWLRVADIKIPDGRLHSHLDDHNDFEESIKAEGVIQPLHVFEDENGNYWLADGQNRLETVKSQGKPLIQAYVIHGDKQDAILYSAKINVLRGRVNVGELAEFLAHIKTSSGWTIEKIASELHLSKGYVSKLLSIAGNPTVLGKLKKGLISLKEAYNEVLGFLGNQNRKRQDNH